jgi:hypothetical protein
VIDMRIRVKEYFRSGSIKLHPGDEIDETHPYYEKVLAWPDAYEDADLPPIIEPEPEPSTEEEPPEVEDEVVSSKSALAKLPKAELVSKAKSLGYEEAEGLTKDELVELILSDDEEGDEEEEEEEE